MFVVECGECGGFGLKRGLGREGGCLVSRVVRSGKLLMAVVLVWQWRRWLWRNWVLKSSGRILGGFLGGFWIWKKHKEAGVLGGLCV